MRKWGVPFGVINGKLAVPKTREQDARAGVRLFACGGRRAGTRLATHSCG